MYKKKAKEEYRPCTRCKISHKIENRMKWLCKECNDETTKERRGDLTRLFLEIWRERLHICNHCGESLGDEPKPVFFSHIKSRGAYPELKMDKNNIELLCLECHQRWDFGDKKSKNK